MVSVSIVSLLFCANIHIHPWPNFNVYFGNFSYKLASGPIFCILSQLIWIGPKNGEVTHMLAYIEHLYGNIDIVMKLWCFPFQNHSIIGKCQCYMKTSFSIVTWLLQLMFLKIWPYVIAFNATGFYEINYVLSFYVATPHIMGGVINTSKW